MLFKAKGNRTAVVSILSPVSSSPGHPGYRGHRRKLDMTAGCFKLRTTISHSFLTLQKEKSLERVSVRASIEGQKAKKHPTCAEYFFLFVEEPF